MYPMLHPRTIFVISVALLYDYGTVHGSLQAPGEDVKR